MLLSEGDKLGHYQILGPLGAGGMGEVYRAHDTQLDRDVAIKVLPHALANDPERLARFDREARILAALNHECKPSESAGSLPRTRCSPIMKYAAWPHASRATPLGRPADCASFQTVKDPAPRAGSTV